MVGPVRSGRLTDEGIADDLNHPVFAYSGTNGIFLPILRSQPLTDVDDDNQPGLFYRSNLNVAPHNLYSNVVSLAGASTTHAPPPALFGFLPAGGHFTGPGVAPDVHIGLALPAAAVTWDWSAASRLWLRGQNGSADTDRSGAQLSATNVIVQFVRYITSGIATGEGGPPAPIPEGILVGSGPAWYFSNGEVVKGTWHRSALTSTTAYLQRRRCPGPADPGPDLGGVGAGRFHSHPGAVGLTGSGAPALRHPASRRSPVRASRRSVTPAVAGGRRPSGRLSFSSGSSPLRPDPAAPVIRPRSAGRARRLGAWLPPTRDPPFLAGAPALTWSNGAWPRCCGAG